MKLLGNVSYIAFYAFITFVMYCAFQTRLTKVEVANTESIILEIIEERATRPYLVSNWALSESERKKTWGNIVNSILLENVAEPEWHRINTIQSYKSNEALLDLLVAIRNYSRSCHGKLPVGDMETNLIGYSLRIPARCLHKVRFINHALRHYKYTIGLNMTHV